MCDIASQLSYTLRNAVQTSTGKDFVAYTVLDEVRTLSVSLL